MCMCCRINEKDTLVNQYMSITAGCSSDQQVTFIENNNHEIILVTQEHVWDR